MRSPALILALVILLGGVTLLVVMVTRPPEDLDGAGAGDDAAERRAGDAAPPGPRRLEPPPDEPGGETPEAGSERGSAETGSRTPVTGTVFDDRGDTIEGATVSVVTYMDHLRAQAASGRGGKFAIAVASEPPFELLAKAVGHTATTIRILRGDSDVLFRLRRLLRILGEVVDDATGEKVGKGTLLLRRLRPTGEPDEQGLGFEMKEGRFVLADLAAGRYVLTVNVPGYDGWISEEIRLSRDEPDAKLEVRVGRSGPWGALKIVVQDPTGHPVKEVNRVLLHDPESGFLAMTDLGVAAPVRLEAPAGRHGLQVMVDGFLPEARAVEVPEGSEAEVTVTLRAAGHVRIGVEDAAGEAVRDFRLAVFDADGEELDYDLRLTSLADFDVELASEPFIADPVTDFSKQGTVGKNQVIPVGPVEMKNLPPGRYRIVATREGVNPAEATVDVEASSTAEVKLALR